LSATVSVSSDTAVFFFSSATGQGINAKPFQVTIDPNLTHGATQTLTLELLTNFVDRPALPVTLAVGVAPAGTLFTHVTNDMAFTVSNVGQYGFGDSSAYAASGAGLRFRNGRNLLYEAGLVVGRNSLQLASGVRDSVGVSYYSDFRGIGAPVFRQSVAGAQALEIVCDDRAADIPIPVTIRQTTTSFLTATEAGFVILEFAIRNASVEPITNLRLGFFSDLDLTNAGSADIASYDSSRRLYAQSAVDVSVGIMALSAMQGVATLVNAPGKSTLTQAQKYALLTATEPTALATPADYFAQMNFGPISLGPGDSAVFALALAVGSDMATMLANADRAREKYLTPTGAVDGDDNLVSLPERFSLGQNYPNPFNPETTIPLSLGANALVDLSVYNTVGQRVRTLVSGAVSAGEHRVTWAGETDSGSRVASGIYFYRLTVNGRALTRAMTLVK